MEFRTSLRAMVIARIAAAWVHVGLDIGMVFFSIYFVHSVGTTPRNRAVLQQALSIAKSYGSPWMIAGDLNMPPAILLQSCGPMLEQADAYVFAFSEATRCPQRGGA